MKRTIRLNESQLRRIVSESVKRVLKEEDEKSDSYYWSISRCKGKKNKPLDWECMACVEDSATSDDASQASFSTPEEAYSDGLSQLKYYNDDLYMLEVYYFTPNGAGDYFSGYIAFNAYGDIKEL